MERRSRDTVDCQTYEPVENKACIDGEGNLYFQEIAQ